MEKLLTPITEQRLAALDERHTDAFKGVTPEAEADQSGKKNYRSRAQRDRDRILYSSSLARLAYVTQVTAPESGHIFHNRLSHTLKVAQVGRRNAERLQQLAGTKDITGAAATLVRAVNPDAVEASCLAHDLGHPPFGHIAEEELQAKACAVVPDAFEGNAQSFRIVTRLSVRTADPGLDLTRRTLDGLLSTPGGTGPTIRSTESARTNGATTPTTGTRLLSRATGGLRKRQTTFRSVASRLS